MGRREATRVEEERFEHDWKRSGRSVRASFESTANGGALPSGRKQRDEREDFDCVFNRVATERVSVHVEQSRVLRVERRRHGEEARGF